MKIQSQYLWKVVFLEPQDLKLTEKNSFNPFFLRWIFNITHNPSEAC